MSTTAATAPSSSKHSANSSSVVTLVSLPAKRTNRYRLQANTAQNMCIVRAWNARPARLRPISPQAYDRFALAWDRVATEFVHAPSEATREAEDLVYNLLAA